MSQADTYSLRVVRRTVVLYVHKQVIIKFYLSLNHWTALELFSHDEKSTTADICFTAELFVCLQNCVPVLKCLKSIPKEL